MATARSNSALTGLRGRVGDLVYKRYGDKIVVTRVPQFDGEWSAAQRRAREQFAAASRYAMHSALAGDLGVSQMWALDPATKGAHLPAEATVPVQGATERFRILAWASVPALHPSGQIAFRSGVMT